MKFLSLIKRLQKDNGKKYINIFHHNGKKTISDYKQQMLVTLGREQFKTMLRRGLSIPVVLL